MSKEWHKKNNDFNKKLAHWKNIYNSMSNQDRTKHELSASNTLAFLNSRYHPEKFSVETLTLIYVGLRQNSNANRENFLTELDGSKYKMYFQRHYELSY